jgi:hypothetical protein
MVSVGVAGTTHSMADAFTRVAGALSTPKRHVIAGVPCWNEPSTVTTVDAPTNPTDGTTLVTSGRAK